MIPILFTDNGLPIAYLTLTRNGQPHIIEYHKGAWSMQEVGPQVPFSEEVHKSKHRLPGETFREACYRQASATKDNDDHFHAVAEMLLDMRYMLAGRAQRAMGSTLKVTGNNCYVSGKIEDTFTGPGGIMERAAEAATTMRMGGGIGFNFSSLRPRGSLIKSLGSSASGPVSFMEIFNAVGLATSSSGHRRGAMMGMLDSDHPDIVDFIHAKHNQTSLTGFNISVAVDDQLMKAVQEDSEYTLWFENQPAGTVKARTLWEQLMRSTWDWAEPGVVFLDTMNRMNNLYYCEYINTTNPCSEQPLPEYGACCLGSFNLVKYVHPIEGFNKAKFAIDIHHAVRAMDNVVGRTMYPLHEQHAEAMSKRRIGMGVTGLANAGEYLGYRYGSEEFLKFEAMVLELLRDRAYLESAILASDKGPFPLFNKEKYLDGNFAGTLPGYVRDEIARNGIRNSHLLSIAPTGTISITADNVSSGIEPVWRYEYERAYNAFDGMRTEKVQDYGYRVWGIRGKTTEECTVQDHLNVLCTAQQYVDSAVSKTCNVPKDTPWEEFKNIYMEAWKRGAKGCATFTEGGGRQGILKGEACSVDEAGRKECT